MADNIYLIQNHGKLQAMNEQPYDTEELLQKLLEDYPELLGTDQTTATTPWRLLLIAREFGVPGEEEGYDRWSLDHLFIGEGGKGDANLSGKFTSTARCNSHKITFYVSTIVDF